MSQKYELIHSASSTSSLFIYCRDIRSSSLCGTNIASSPTSASLIPEYPIPVPYSRIRSSKNSAIFYSKLFGSEGGFADKCPKGAEYSKSSKHPEGKPDLNYFFQLKPAHPIARSPFHLGKGAGGLGPDGPFVLDSFRLCAALNPRFLQAIHSPKKCLTPFAV